MNYSGRAFPSFLLPFALSSPLSAWFLLSPLLSIKHANNLINHLSHFAWGDSEEGGCHPNKPFYPCKCFLYCLSVCLEASAARAQKLLNNRSSEAAGRRWHLSPITVEPPFPCRRPHQPVSHIYDPLSVVTSVEPPSPAAWPSHKHCGLPTWSRPLVGPWRILQDFAFIAPKWFGFFFASSMRLIHFQGKTTGALKHHVL